VGCKQGGMKADSHLPSLSMGSIKDVKSNSAVDLPYMPRIVSEDAGKTWHEEPPLGVTGKDDPFAM